MLWSDCAGSGTKTPAQNSSLLLQRLDELHELCVLSKGAPKARVEHVRTRLMRGGGGGGRDATPRSVGSAGT